ncbi:MAG: hypothetical protein HYY93_14495 [Planctomycetes bacterium]|nr:hypothetical protein [Planctomycetota bacterium]
MKRRMRFLIGLVLLLPLAGCITRGQPRDLKDREKQKAPLDAYYQFQQHLYDLKLDKAYQLFSKDTRERYKYGEFSMMINQTRFGQLILDYLIRWEVWDLQMDADGKRAVIEIVHPEQRQVRKEIEVLLEGENDWRIHFTLAGALGIADEDELELLRKK